MSTAIAEKAEFSAHLMVLLDRIELSTSPLPIDGSALMGDEEEANLSNNING